MLRMKNKSRSRCSPSSISSMDSAESSGTATSTAPTSIACSHSHRWSELVPPDSGLTFAVVWDPEEKDILSFSTAGLSESRPFSDGEESPDSPTDAYDNQSQILTIGPSVVPNSEYTATLDFFRDNHDFLFSEPIFSFDRPTRTSSTLDGLDVYLRGSLLGEAHKSLRHYSFFENLDGDFTFDPRTSFAQMWMKSEEDVSGDDVSDEGFFEHGTEDEKEGNLSSAFSTTTTSSFVPVVTTLDDDDASSTWSNLEAPNTPSFSRLLFANARCSNRRLRKARPSRIPAPPSDTFEHKQRINALPNPDIPSPPDSSRPPSRASSLSLPKFARSLSLRRWKRCDSDRWVLVEITQEITQSYV